MADRLTGKASYFQFNSFTIPITKFTPKVTRKLADITDSSDYNSTNDMIYPTQIPVSTMVEGSIEGRFHKSVIPTAILAVLWTSITLIPIVFGLDLAPTVYGHGYFDISDFTTDVPVDDVVTYTANVKSNGIFTPNS